MRSRLATHSEGRIRVSPHVPNRRVSIDGKTVNLRSRLKTHERVEKKLMDAGMPYNPAHERALKKEHKDMTKHQVFVYEGTLGAIARHKPWHFK